MPIEQSMRYDANVRLDDGDHWVANEMDDVQLKWPVPPFWMLVGFFLAGFFGLVYGGGPGVVVVFMLALLVPCKLSWDMLVNNHFISVLTIITAASIIGNYDAIGDVLGNDSIRFSWIMIGLGVVILPFQFNALRETLLVPVILTIAFFAFQIITAIETEHFVNAVEANGSYALATLVILSAVIQPRLRDSLVWQLSLIAAVSVAFNFYEMLYPDSLLSISSAKLEEETQRAAGLYANSNVSGVMISGILMFVAFGCEKKGAGLWEKVSLATLTVICGIGVTLTFSRSSILAFFMVVALVAFRFSNSQFNKIAMYLPTVILLALISFFGVGEFLASNSMLSHDAQQRYDAIKGALTGDFEANVGAAVNSRKIILEDTKAYWQDPSLLGRGAGFILFTGVLGTHNMFLFLLIEIGVIGLVLYLFLLTYFSNFGGWKLTIENLILFSCVFLPILLLQFQEHSFLRARYFSLYLVMLLYVSNILLPQNDEESKREYGFFS